MRGEDRGLLVGGVATRAAGRCRALGGGRAGQGGCRRVTFGAGKAYHPRDFVGACSEENVTPHLARADFVSLLRLAACDLARLPRLWPPLAPEASP